MHVFLNGQFVPEEHAFVSVFDRGLTLGDGLYETTRVIAGRPLLWEKHAARLEAGVELLRLKLPYALPQLRRFAGELIRLNGVADAVLRLTVTRGPGPRGYSIRDAGPPSVVMTLSSPPADAAPPWRLITASQRVVPSSHLAYCKTLSRLPHVLARAEAEARGADEALLLNTRDEIAEAVSANLFWIGAGPIVCTPPLECGGLAGVTRAMILELCAQLNIPTRETAGSVQILRTAEGVFLTLSTGGVVPAAALDGQPLAQSPLTLALRREYERMLDRFRAARDEERFAPG